MHSKRTRTDSAAVAARAAVIVLDAERRTCRACQQGCGLCEPLLVEYGRLTEVIVAGRHDQARDVPVLGVAA